MKKLRWITETILLPLVILIAFWIIGERVVGSVLILPGPGAVFTRFFEMWQSVTFRRHIGATVLRSIGSFGLSLIISLLLGLLTGFSRTADNIMKLPLSVIKATPVVSFILLALFWFSTDNVPVFVSVLMSLPVLTAAISSGIKRTDAKLLAMAKVYGFSRSQTLFHVYLPSMLPFFFSGALSAFGLSWKVVVAAEVISLPKYAAGSALQTAKVHLETPDVFVTTISIITISFVLETLVATLIRLINDRRGNSNVQPTVNNSPAMNKTGFAASAVDTAYNSAAASSENIVIQELSMNRGGKQLYSRFSYTFKADTITALIAPSGSGKTSLLDWMAGFIEADAAAGPLTQKPAYLFQEPRLLPWHSVEDNILLPLEKSFGKDVARLRARRFLEIVQLSDKRDCRPSQLSGGEKQRAALARAFAFPSPVLLMDEAFQSQDLRLKLQLMETLEMLLKAERRTVVFVTHDINEAAAFADRITVLSGTPLSIRLDLERNLDRSIPLKQRYLDEGAGSDCRTLLSATLAD